jgi:pimeloyl-ACP methyl ester carboxylesterase
LTGKYEQWSAKCPIYLVGHSYGGLTARVLQHYLADSKFDGYDTDSSWVAGIIAVNSPLNGAMMTYVLGEHICHPPVVHWGSVGFWLSNIIHLLSFMDLAITKQLMNPKLGACHSHQMRTPLMHSQYLQSNGD